ncbi:MAG: 1-deoxy-D-xylulose-5-phosphate reductoisomerase, partial [Candidatus Competibacteraceae bacterium]|nr:1-deoxy-D-xylulose-5-phosphate reductoisomerase [Candidatus Competibacteraceae bacterium]
ATFLDFAQVARLEFASPDFSRFPCLKLAFVALEAGGTAPVILNAANEIAVQAFLERQIRYTDIHTVVQYTLERVNRRVIASLAVILDDDAQARIVAGEWVAAHGGGLS